MIERNTELEERNEKDSRMHQHTYSRPRTLISIAAGFAAIFAAVWQSSIYDTLDQKMGDVERATSDMEEQYRSHLSSVATLMTPESLYGKAMDMNLVLTRIDERK
ncbi:MAG: hypothetical protein LKE40_02905 [Spirochaetia bacterium]|jgi:hypothetical protein|nr:hypothetical protein [Spirochaetia bacterium]